MCKRAWRKRVRCMMRDGQCGMEYDDENQLVSITVTNVWRSEFVYDGRTRRRVKRDYVDGVNFQASVAPGAVKYRVDQGGGSAFDSRWRRSAGR